MRAAPPMEPISKQKLAKILADLKAGLRAIYGERLARTVLFGSQARGEARVYSDIDVLVTLRGEVEPAKEIARTADVVAELSLREDVVIACVFLDEGSYESENSPLLLNVRREGVAV